MSQKRVARTQEAIQEVFLRLYVTIRSKESALAPFEPALEATLPDRDRGTEGGLIEPEVEAGRDCRAARWRL